MGKDYGFDTLSIHGGAEKNHPKNALNPPIFMTSTYVFDDVKDAEDIMNFEKQGFIYTRGNNPTLQLFEKRMAALEEGEDAVAFASGMAAISSVLFSLLSPKDNVVVHKTLYGSSFTVTHKLLPKYHIDCKSVDFTEPKAVEGAIDKNTKVLYFETPANPNLAIIDIQQIVRIAKTYGVKVVVDNTFATPYFQRPLAFGADVVVHSATKYICGHGDALGGVAVSKDADYIKKLKFDYMCEFGGVMSPFNAWLMLRGLKTLGLRMRQHEANAMAIAEFLKSHDSIEEVFYPGLADFRGHELAKRQMDGFGAVMSFEVKGGLKAAKRFINSVKLAKIAVSLGDCETLIELPAAMTHAGYPKARLQEFDLTDSIVRLSVGIENVKDIIEDLDNALKV
ncbi:Methionine gamma-lyase [Tepidanaerobacter acetatoxydans Re1]|uniref:homocysteine desulfhydrase n=1 Tax=Tepidanaerobacter acetatoxydans (strain DSM 21804 / JCM 16047 / Re1) TaxID=1209989 RepID=F4LQP9_TEPAE|nr:PLP-dependent aspartate aminotransferase family protein [Tepidanaerobacter acetatoxydans]AEE92052.1 Cys/Met metabolism pyridoxal-phosphate-dependent protein [Tepidanaerobacter acetatoxydans Re1]CCP26895.1 Methionine gamma-lyase [Tepidanaerobacter acetatoxydans Re1]